MLTVVIAALFVSFFPRSTDTPRSLLGFRYFSDTEAKILNVRVLRDEPSKVHAHVNVKPSEMKDAVRQPFSVYVILEVTC